MRDINLDGLVGDGGGGVGDDDDLLELEPQVMS